MGGRIGLMFLIASCILVFIAYFVLSQNFQKLLTDYTVTLVQAMVDQGVTTVEYELRISREEAEVLAGSLSVPEDGEQTADFPNAFFGDDVLRIVYTPKDGTFASDGTYSNKTYVSDGKRYDPRGRRDIKEALEGNPAVCGPYFNEEEEYIICYSAPVIRNGVIVGAVSIEKDGYKFCDLIKDIRFASSGESYLINSEGTDIAVSDWNHIEWVNDQYNARKLLEEEEDPVTRSVMELEDRGLSGETGVGTYYWTGSLCYVAYAPVPSVGWVLLAGLRQEEIDSMTQSVLYASIAKGPALTISLLILLVLTGTIVYWIVSSMKKNAEINEKLNQIANYDSLTGTMNRNSYHTVLDALTNESSRTLACIYIDVNGLHEINNHLGHQAGDIMLKTVADMLLKLFSQSDVFRIGGDEFVVLCRDRDRQDAERRIELIRQDLKEQGYFISVGIEWQDQNMDIKKMVNSAEEAMQRDKQRYYLENGKERQMRSLDRELEQMVLEKQDAETFLSVLAPEFKGVYFVDLGADTIRHLFIPDYFEKMLEEADDVFSRALLLYAQRSVMPEYRRRLERFCDYGFVESQLENGAAPEYTYQKTDGTWMKLRVLKFKTYTVKCRETLWIFSNTD